MFRKITISFVLCASFAYGAEIHWAYEGEYGPDKWGDLHESFKECKLGEFQSPINIEPQKAQKIANELKFEYQNAMKEIVDNGHTLMITPNSQSSITYKKTKMQLVQYHFHTPAENHIDGIEYPLELHLVHKDSQGNLAVIGVLFEEGTANKALDSIIKAMPKDKDKSNSITNVDMYSLLPEKRGYYEFIGSLTTPPCSGDVKWVLMKEKVQASKSQIDSLHTVLKYDARGIQPLNERIIKHAD